MRFIGDPPNPRANNLGFARLSHLHPTLQLATAQSPPLSFEWGAPPIPGQGGLLRIQAPPTPGQGGALRIQPLPIPGQGGVLRIQPLPTLAPGQGGVLRTQPLPIPGQGGVLRIQSLPIPCQGGVLSIQPLPIPGQGGVLRIEVQEAEPIKTKLQNEHRPRKKKEGLNHYKFAKSSSRRMACSPRTTISN